MAEPEEILVSVIICAHNPRPDYLRRVLDALASQTLPKEQWELLLIDNASQEPLATAWDLSWHPHARHIHENELGLTPARLRGIRESRAELLVFVDDDNVLAADYLRNALDLASRHPQLGVWGGGITLRFEQPPAEWTRRYWPFLAQRTVNEDVIATTAELSGPLPVGAGCCVRKAVADSFARQVATSELRRSLDRSGNVLTSGGDTDLVLTACEIGFSRGLFKSLQVDHLIAPRRVEEDYLVRLSAGITLSGCILEMIHTPHQPPPAINWWWWLKFGCDCAFKFGRQRKFYVANKQAQRQARKLYESVRSKL